MHNWQDVQGKKATMQREAVAALDPAERDILAKVLELEWEDRHLKTPDFRRALRNLIQQVIR